MSIRLILKATLAILVYIISAASLFAQNEIDAIRLSQLGSGVGARALGMGGAYTAVSNDFSALFYNPAGLGQMKRMELSAGFDAFSYNSDATYLGNTQNSAVNRTGLQNLSFVIPFPTYQGSFVMAVGYNRQANFNAAQTVDVFNPSGSIIDSWIRDFNPEFDSQNKIVLKDIAAYAFNQFLIDDRVINNVPGYVRDTNIVFNRVQQGNDIFESGGRNAFSTAFALEVAPALFVGGTLNILSGSYSFNRTYTERNTQDPLRAFNSFAVTDNITTELSGWNLKLGLLHVTNNHFKLGLTVETPTFYALTDNFNSTLTTTYKRAPAEGEPLSFRDVIQEGDFNYTLKTPFIFGGGVSFEEDMLTIAAQATYTDWTQLEYNSDTDPFTDVNAIFRKDFRATFDWSVGGELRFAKLPIRLRGGYNIQQTPLKFRDVERQIATSLDDARKTLSFGIGILLGKTLNVDIAYLQTSQTLFSTLYKGSSPISEQLKLQNIIVTTSFRF
jgi:long-subunit fatty acid transport protein